MKPTHSSRGSALALIGLVLAGVIAAIIIASSSGSSRQTSSLAAAGSRTTAHKASHKRSHAAASAATGAAAAGAAAPSPAAATPAASSSSSSSAASVAGGSSPSGGASTPVGAVETFYHFAAAHQYGSAWALADPAFRNQLEGYQSFAAGQSGERSITFDSASLMRQSGSSATVYIRTTSMRSDGTQHCYGPVNLVQSSSGWLLDHISINCT